MTPPPLYGSGDGHAALLIRRLVLVLITAQQPRRRGHRRHRHRVDPLPRLVPFRFVRAFQIRVVRGHPRLDRVEAELCDGVSVVTRSEEHTSELQSRPHLVCRLLLEKKKSKTTQL